MQPFSLLGKKGLIIGIANNKSIAFGCAKQLHHAGADLAITYLNDKAEPFVRPLAENLDAPIIMPCDVQKEDDVAHLFEKIYTLWGHLDFLVHSIAFAPKADLHGPVVDCSLEGFLTAMDISCHSLLRLSKRAAPLMKNGGSIMTISYYGSEKVVAHYNMMGIVKAALEASVRYLAADLGPSAIRVNALSPSAILTRAGSGISHFDDLLTATHQKATFLASGASKNITGGVHYIDGGYEIMD
jgi:enoyl-[acyl-carrier protein] reductase I